ncbi:CCN family member 1-like [Periophthalmus magnuspinnatus]|uniref:CCN family member 1-like n=1 Tax=Periophthalmus magnuspinnatus TaxID=409849 RepID=UPI00243646A1|nr:CCN family member 1-like [Periophthalmus magnuspinnatus]
MTTAVITQVTGSCSARCPCPGEPVLCPAGVSAVSNGCGCCKVCAAQLNQDCGPLKPCDHHKGLECNYGNDVTMAEGVCTAKSEGRTCEYNGRMYQNGESFRVGCKHQCTCLDGAVGCAPLCINKLPPPSPTCPLPSLIKTPGKCCPFVHCHKRTWHLSWKKKVTPLKQHLPRPKLSNDLKEGWENQYGLRHLPGKNVMLRRMKENTCPVQTTSWSQCSRSCGTGISSRISNKNTECKLQKETRICTIRPCHSLLVPKKKVQKCSPTQKAPGALRLSYGECVSLRLYRPNYCSVCADGRCCSPQKTRTIPVSFVCPSGQSFHKSAMFVQSCKCSTDCGHLNEVALPPQHWMYGDTHKFID